MQTPKILFQILFFAVLTIIAADSLGAQQNNEAIVLTADSLADGKTLEFHKTAWKYRAGDRAEWAAKDFDDRDWKTFKNEEIERDVSLLENWNGRAWFRQRVAVDETLANQPLALRAWHWGASEIFVDGKMVARYGKIESDRDVESNPRGLFVPIVFPNAGEHTIAVRYSYSAAADLSPGTKGRWLANGGYVPSVWLFISSGAMAAERLRESSRGDRITYVFIGVLFALALVHLLLFAFYPPEKGNLYYSLFAAGFGLAFLMEGLPSAWQFTAFEAAVSTVVHDTVQIVAIMSLLLFFYNEFAPGAKIVFRILIVLWLATVAFIIVRMPWAFGFELVILGATLAECLRVLALALVRRKPGAWNIALGLAVLVFGIAFNILTQRNVVESGQLTRNTILFVAVSGIPVAVSVYLARNFARANKNLAVQLAREVEHEKEKSRLLIVEAENERRAKELEEARQLQISMLPKRLPQIANLEIAVYMKPATEVGGDYYDFYLSENGTLTVAIGDATGHGLKAGTVVTAVKSLFNNLAAAPDVSDTFRQISRSLKSMNLRGLFMAMTILKLKDSRLVVCTAGMPATLIYRAETGRIEEVELRQMPLGSVSNFAYQARELALSAGDCVVAMSDGFPEMFNEAGEMLADDRAKTVLAESAQLAAQEIVNRFVSVGEAWAGNRAPDDDVTFVVLKVK